MRESSSGKLNFEASMTLLMSKGLDLFDWEVPKPDIIRFRALSMVLYWVRVYSSACVSRALGSAKALSCEDTPKDTRCSS